MILDNQMFYILLGGGTQIILWISYKILKNPKTYLILLFLSCIIALFGYSNINRESLKMVNGNAVEWTFFPLLFMLYYWLL